MGRGQEFDHNQALERAMYVFWEKGYENTSLKDLLEAMQIQNGSFYHFFGNKRNLFKTAFEFYDDDFKNKRETLFRSNSGFKKNIRILFHHIFDRQKAAVCPKGCFLFNSVDSDILNDLDLYKLVRRGVDDFEQFLESEISKAIKNNEIKDSVDPKFTASLLVAYCQGIMKLSVLDYADSKFRDQTKYFLDKLGI